MKVLSVAALLTFVAGPAFAAAPAVSRGEVLLSITFEECMERAKKVFPLEGYTIVPDEEGATSFVLARKDIHTAYITCSPGPREETWTNVFVSSWSHDKKVPGAERVKLQTRMAGGPIKKHK